jgi:hypothetical protein
VKKSEMREKKAILNLFFAFFKNERKKVFFYALNFFSRIFEKISKNLSHYLATAHSSHGVQRPLSVIRQE